MGDMVSREEPPAPRRPAASAALFDTWRAILSRGIAGAQRRAQRAARATVHVGRGAADAVAAASAGSASARERLALPAGLAVILIAVGLSGLMAAPESRLRAVATALVAGMWVFARLPVMRVVAERLTATDARTVTPAWSAGALLHMVALTPGLRLLAWAGGAILTYRTLRVTGANRRDARTIAVWGYGLEALGFVLISLARSLTIAILWLGGAPG